MRDMAAVSDRFATDCTTLDLRLERAGIEASTEKLVVLEGASGPVGMFKLEVRLDCMADLEGRGFVEAEAAIEAAEHLLEKLREIAGGKRRGAA